MLPPVFSSSSPRIATILHKLPRANPRLAPALPKFLPLPRVRLSVSPSLPVPISPAHQEKSASRDQLPQHTHILLALPRLAAADNAPIQKDPTRPHLRHAFRCSKVRSICRTALPVPVNHSGY